MNAAVTSIAPIDFEDLDPGLRTVLRARYERLGYLGDFFRYMAHQPRALAAFDEYTEACKSALPPALTEAVALTVATAVGNLYERNQHERLALTLGLTREWVGDVEQLAPDDDSTTLDPTVRAVQAFALAAIDPAREDTPRLLDAVVASIGEAAAVAVTLLTARFAAHALVSRACGFSAPVPSIFDDDDDAEVADGA